MLAQESFVNGVCVCQYYVMMAALSRSSRHYTFGRHTQTCIACCLSCYPRKDKFSSQSNLHTRVWSYHNYNQQSIINLQLDAPCSCFMFMLSYLHRKSARHSHVEPVWDSEETCGRHASEFTIGAQHAVRDGRSNREPCGRSLWRCYLHDSARFLAQNKRRFARVQP